VPSLANFPLSVSVAVFLVAAAAIALSGVRLSWLADELADRTGLGEIIAGALFVGASTSLPGAITSVSTAASGFPELAIGNAVGGLTAQTAFIAIADLAYRRANLEHAAASPVGLAQGLLLIVLLTVPLIAAAEAPVTVLGVHPASVLNVVIYLFGLRLLARIQNDPMWHPVQTSETREVISEPRTDQDADSDSALWTRFVIHAVITGLAGYCIGLASIAIVSKSGLSQTAMGTAFAAVANSLPELVTAIAAVRIGAVNLAVGDVIGGNAFEVLFLSAADFFYAGSIYAQFSAADRRTTLIALMMTSVILLGMVRRERTGFVGIGFESTLVLALYAASVVLLFF
jgi:cation:H+ antiporter